MILGYAGQPMLVIKANRALLKKGNTFKKVKKMFLNSSVKTELKFKKVSPEKLAQLKAEIRKRAKEDTRKEAGIYFICTVMVVWFLYWILYT